MLEEEPEDPTCNKARNGQTCIRPDHLGVFGHRRKSNTKSRTKGILQKEKRHDKRFHCHWSLGVGILQTGNGGQNFRHTNQEISGSLKSNVDSVRSVSVLRSTRHGEFVTWTSSIDEMLQNGSVNHGGSAKHETPENLGDGSERRESSDERIHDTLANGDENDDGDGVDGLENIVGETVELHLTGRRNEIVRHLAVNQPVDGVDAEDLTGVQGSLDLIDKLVVPRELFFLD